MSGEAGAAPGQWSHRVYGANHQHPYSWDAAGTDFVSVWGRDVPVGMEASGAGTPVVTTRSSNLLQGYLDRSRQSRPMVAKRQERGRDLRNEPGLGMGQAHALRGELLGPGPWARPGQACVLGPALAAPR